MAGIGGNKLPSSRPVAVGDSSQLFLSYVGRDRQPLAEKFKLDYFGVLISDMTLPGRQLLQPLRAQCAQTDPGGGSAH